RLSALHVGVTKAFREKELAVLNHDNDRASDVITEQLRRYEGVEEDFQISSGQLMTLRVIGAGLIRRSLRACRRLLDTERHDKPSQYCKYCASMNRGHSRLEQSRRVCLESKFGEAAGACTDTCARQRGFNVKEFGRDGFWARASAGRLSDKDRCASAASRMVRA